MNHLRRSLAPVSDAAWAEIEEEATRTLKATLAGRKLVDFNGPLGWHASAVGVGRVDSVAEPPVPGGRARLRRVQPLLELEVVFELDRAELDSIDRGASDADLDPVIDAARTMAMAEDRAIFHGYEGGRIEGMCEAAAGSAVTITDDYERYPVAVAAALTRLRSAGVGDPYAIALGPRCYTGLTETTSHGYPVIEHVRRMLSGPIVWAPGVDGAVVLSMRGGDFELTVGQDVSIGYLDHDDTSVRLYLQESLTFRVLSPEAGVWLAYERS